MITKSENWLAFVIVPGLCDQSGFVTECMEFCNFKSIHLGYTERKIVVFEGGCLLSPLCYKCELDLVLGS